MSTWPCAALTAGDEPARCAAVADDAARLACYDAIFRKGGAGTEAMPAASPAAAGVAAVAPAASPPPAVAPSGKEAFGLSAERQVASQPGVEEITATVVSVSALPQPGRWSVTLDNGQVWEQRETTSAANRPRPGDSVTISKASLGSFLLHVPGRGLSRVRRVK